MASCDISGERDLERLRREFLERAGKGFDRMFGQDQQEVLVTFSQREERAVDISRDLARSLIEEHIASDSAAQPSLHAEAGKSGGCTCPRCGKPGQLGSKPEDPLPGRQVQSLAGEVGLEREQYICTPCRVTFFPSGLQVGADDGGVQSQGVAEGGATGK